MLKRIRAETIVLFFSLFALGTAFAFQRIRSLDYWWHLRTGALIAESGAVPTADPYTYTVPGAPWIDIHWLFQLGLHGLYRLGGHDAVVVAKVALVWALLGILATIGWRRDAPVVTVFALGSMLLVACDRFMPRPELPSFVLLASVLALLDRDARREDAWVFAIVPLQIVWVNLHSLFALGIAICAMAFAAELVRPLVVPGDRWQTRRLRRLGLLTALVALASLANPNLLDGALYPVQQLGMIGPPEGRGLFGSLIAELIPPLALQTFMTPLTLLVAASLAVLSFAAMALNWRRTSALDPLLWVAFLYLALGAYRNLALFAIVAVPILVRNLNAVLDRRSLRPRAMTSASVAFTGVLALVSADVFSDRFFARLGIYREAGFGVFDPYYPIGAAEWIARERPPGPIFHHMGDGGYLIWRLHPDYPVMVDGRLELFGEQRFAELQMAGPHRFRALDARYRFGIALLHYTLVNSQDLMRWLHLNSTWRLVFADDVAALFVRLGKDGSSRWPEVDVDAPDLFPPLSPDSFGSRDQVQRFARVNFYTMFRRYERALALWEETLERHPGLPEGPVIRAHLLHASGFPAAAEAILRQLVEDRPTDAKLRAQIGDLRLEASDLEAAKAEYDLAQELDPKLSYATLRRAMLAQVESDDELAVRLYWKVVLTAHPADPAAVIAGEHLAAYGASGDLLGDGL